MDDASLFMLMGEEERFHRHVREVTASIAGPCVLDLSGATALLYSGFSSFDASINELRLVLPKSVVDDIYNCCNEHKVKECFIIRNELVNFKKLCLHLYHDAQEADQTLRRYSTVFFCDIVHTPLADNSALRYTRLCGAMMQCKGHSRMLLDLREQCKYICSIPRHPDLDDSFPDELKNLPESLGIYGLVEKAQNFTGTREMDADAAVVVGDTLLEKVPSVPPAAAAVIDSDAPTITTTAAVAEAAATTVNCHIGDASIGIGSAGDNSAAGGDNDSFCLLDFRKMMNNIHQRLCFTLPEYVLRYVELVFTARGVLKAMRIRASTIKLHAAIKNVRQWAEAVATSHYTKVAAHSTDGEQKESFRYILSKNSSSSSSSSASSSTTPTASFSKNTDHQVCISKQPVKDRIHTDMHGNILCGMLPLLRQSCAILSEILSAPDVRLFSSGDFRTSGLSCNNLMHSNNRFIQTDDENAGGESYSNSLVGVSEVVRKELLSGAADFSRLFASSLWRWPPVVEEAATTRALIASILDDGRGQKDNTAELALSVDQFGSTVVDIGTCTITSSSSSSTSTSSTISKRSIKIKATHQCWQCGGMFAKMWVKTCRSLHCCIECERLSRERNVCAFNTFITADHFHNMCYFNSTGGNEASGSTAAADVVQLTGGVTKRSIAHGTRSSAAQIMKEKEANVSRPASGDNSTAKSESESEYKKSSRHKKYVNAKGCPGESAWCPHQKKCFVCDAAMDGGASASGITSVIANNNINLSSPPTTTSTNTAAISGSSSSSGCDGEGLGCVLCGLVRGGGEFLLDYIDSSSRSGGNRGGERIGREGEGGVRYVFLDFDRTLSTTKRGENPLPYSSSSSSSSSSSTTTASSSAVMGGGRKHSVDPYLREICCRSRSSSCTSSCYEVHIITRNSHAEAIREFLVKEGCFADESDVNLHVLKARSGISKLSTIQSILQQQELQHQQQHHQQPQDFPVRKGNRTTAPFTAIFADDTLEELLVRPTAARAKEAKKPEAMLDFEADKGEEDNSCCCSMLMDKKEEDKKNLSGQPLGDDSSSSACDGGDLTTSPCAHHHEDGCTVLRVLFSIST